jgi:hypothetical protein
MAGADAYLDKAIRLEDTLTKASQHFVNALTIYGRGITDGMTLLNGTLSQIGGGRGGIDVVPGGGEADFGALSVGRFGSSSFVPSPRGGSAPSSSTQIDNINIVLPPNAGNLNEEQMAELIAVKLRMELDRRDRAARQVQYQFA